MTLARINLLLFALNVAAFVFWSCELRAVHAQSVFWLLVGAAPTAYVFMRAQRMPFL